MTVTVGRVVPPPASSRFIPVEGSKIVVEMPGEVMRCTVHQVVNNHTVIVAVDGIPMSKTHLFRQGDKVGVRRRMRDGRDVWEALSDRDFIAGRSPANLAVPETAAPPVKKKGGRRAAGARK